MSGNIRRRIGPAKKILLNSCMEADQLLQNPVTVRGTVAEFQEDEDAVSNLLGRINGKIADIERLATEWYNLIQDLDDNDNNDEEEQLERFADGDDGYEMILAKSRDTSAALTARISSIGKRIQELRPVPVAVPPVIPPVQAAAPDLSRLILPKVTIPQFSGDVLKWMAFWESFENAVHNVPNLPGGNKFVLLRQYLSGEPYELVSSYQLTNDDYLLAIAKLKEHYANDRALKQALFCEFCDIPNCGKTYSMSQIRNLLNSINRIVHQLRNLNVDFQQNELAVYILQRKLPRPILIELESDKELNYQWRIMELLEAVNRYLVHRESVSQVTGTYPPSHKQDGAITQKSNFYNRPPVAQKASAETFVSTKDSLLDPVKSSQKKLRPCSFCQGNHYSEDCQKYVTARVRLDFLRASGRCYICLEKGHLGSNCPRKQSTKCVHCQAFGHHNRALCQQKFGCQNPSKAPANHETYCSAGDPAPLSMVSSFKPPTTSLLTAGHGSMLMTANVSVRKPLSKGQRTSYAQCRVVLDSASSMTFCLGALIDHLNIKPTEEQAIQIKTFGGEVKNVNTNVAAIELGLNDGSFLPITVNVVDKLMGNFRREKIPEADLVELRNLEPEQLADDIPNVETEVVPAILIGIDYFWKLMEKQLSSICLPSGLELTPSKFGYLLAGSFPRENLVQENVTMSLAASVDGSKVFMEDNFWALEKIGITDPFDSTDEDAALQQFGEGIVFENDRYHVFWPWKSPELRPPSNFNMAWTRLKSLAKRLRSDGDLLKAYEKNIADLEAKGIIEQVLGDSEQGDTVHYLPHHPVITPQKTTTKVRVVYDASAHASKDLCSLNDCLLTGPNLIPNLCGILMKFRMPKFAILSDIEKAFLQVGLRMPDRDVTRFLWFKDVSLPLSDENLITFRFTRIPFGVNSSPFLLEAVLQHHVLAVNSKLAQEIQDSMYVDNILMCADSVEEAKAKYKEGKQLFGDMSMNLREWTSNSSEFINAIPEIDRSIGTNFKVLGIDWNTDTDELTINTKENIMANDKLTKRKLLKMIASVFDPLGFWTPSTFFGKTLFQETWKLNFDWDTDLPEDICKQWSYAVDALSFISLNPIPRRVSPDLNATFQLIAFSDASSKAYGAVAYLVATSSSESLSQLIYSKMRLKPVRSSKKKRIDLSIPRMELMGILIGVRIINFISNHLKIALETKVLYSDSQCALQWIKSDKPLPLFVKNRVQEIRKSNDLQFRYVPTEENPADYLTKGIPSQVLAKDKTWWHGPPWLLNQQKDQPTFCSPQTFPEIEKEDYEMEQNRHFTCAVMKTGDEQTEIETPLGIVPERFSNLPKLHRVTTLCLKFLKRLAPTKYLKTLEGISTDRWVSTGDVAIGENLWLSYIQEKHFAEVIADIKQQRFNQLQKNLGLFIDSKGLLRCASRFRSSDSSENEFPILIPQKTTYASLLINWFHLKVIHGRVNHTLSALRKCFWIPQGRAAVRNVLKCCHVCKRFGSGSFRLPEFPPFPKDRLKFSPPFTCTGLDYFGPISVKANTCSRKVWVALFTCLVSRAVHLEIVPNLNTAEFLGAFYRFVARRGYPSKIVSDNARQFKMANTIMNKWISNLLHNCDIQNFMIEHKIDWKFIPEFSPWQGGIYERMIGSVKMALKKSLGKNFLTKEQLSTVLCQVEAMVNSRPLTKLNDSPDDIPVLTPMDFLTPGHRTFFPYPSGDHADPDFEPQMNPKVQEIQKLLNKQKELLRNFENLWKNEYLNVLKERFDIAHPRKRIETERKPLAGEVVLIREDRITRGCWPLGRIVSLNKSKDGKIRSVKLQTSSRKQITRPINMLYPLEIYTEADEKRVGELDHDNGGILIKSDRPRRIRAKVDRLIESDILFTKTISAPWSVADSVRLFDSIRFI